MPHKIIYPELRDKNWLETEYLVKQQSMRKIAESMGCSLDTVSRAIERLGIPKHADSVVNAHHGARPKAVKYPKLHDKEWLHNKYSNENLSFPEIASVVGCTYQSVRRAFIKLGLKPRTNSEARRLQYSRDPVDIADMWKGGRNALIYVIRTSTEMTYWKNAVLSRDEACVQCGAVDGLEADHIISMTENIELSLDINNGQTLCTPCHKNKHNTC